MTFLYTIAIIAVIGGHFFFAYGQWFRWKRICARLTHLTETEAEKTASLGRSFASYNASIGVGLCLSFLLPAETELTVQGVVLALIIVTAGVGAMGTRGNTILLARLLPAAIALVLLWLL